MRRITRSPVPGGLRTCLSGLFAAALVVALSPATPARAEVVDIQIGQFNMAGGNKEHGPKGDEAPDALVRSVQDRNPAFITIQEACADWSARLDSRLPGYTVRFDPVLSRAGGPPADCKHPSTFGLAVLYRDDLGIDTTPAGYNLGSPSDQEQRMMLCVSSSARKFAICSVHLTPGDEDWRPGSRRAEAARAKEILATTYAGYTTFVGGDLNDDPLSGALDNFYHPDYKRDAHGAYKEVDSPCRNEMKEGMLLPGIPIPSFVYCRSGEATQGAFSSKIDYLFVPPAVHVRDADVTYALHSDHDPLWADITVDLATPGGGGGGGGTDPVDFPPDVDAGPRGNAGEGQAAELRGSATDRENQVIVSWSYAPSGGTDPGATCALSAPHAPRTSITCTDDGVYTATLTASDGVNPPVSDTTLVTIANAAPVLSLTGPAPWQPFRAGTPVPLAATFTDAGANDTHTCTVTWDDGTTDEYAPSQGSCARSHTFAEPGMYTVKIKVTDDDGASDTAEVMVIVYDPGAGFVTGAGAFDGGRFHLNPKYGPHDEGPAPGQGRVRAGLVDSGDLEWLVVTSRGTAAVKGVSGEHGFVAYATDDPDRFRLVVWRLSDGSYPAGEVVYDNREGASYDLDQAEPPASDHGSIKIHN